MKLSSNNEPIVTIVVVQRERFSYTREGLEYIYKHTQIPFKLVYVDGGSPATYRKNLEAQSREKRFKLIQKNYYISPPRARNLGLSHADTKYVVFLDNDVRVDVGWLKALVQCAEQTQSTVVGPFIGEARSPKDVVHYAGGEAGIVSEINEGAAERHLFKKVYYSGEWIEIVRDRLQPHQTELAELHCMLVDTDIFQEIGVLDEKLPCEDHTDFCLRVNQAGGTVYFEPAAVVTYMPGPLKWSDVPFFMLRWSDAWQIASFTHLQKKWDVVKGQFFQKRFNNLQRFRKRFMIDPLMSRIRFKVLNKVCENILLAIDKILNRIASTCYGWQQAHRLQKKCPHTVKE